MPAKAHDVDSEKKGQISPLTVDGVTPAGVDLHTDSTESIAGPLASARPRYAHLPPQQHGCSCCVLFSSCGGAAASPCRTCGGADNRKCQKPETQDGGTLPLSVHAADDGAVLRNPLSSIEGA
jgi:hypothetical protein